jgi:hypothetical protein
MTIHREDSPAVSFASDMDGDLHMFSSDPDVTSWDVVICNADGSEEPAPSTDNFWGYYTLSPDDRCWYVEVAGHPVAIEIRRPDKPRARIPHPRRSVWDKELQEASPDRARELLEEDLRGSASVRVFPMEERHSFRTRDLVIQELLYDRKEERYVDRRNHMCPPEIDAYTVLSYLKQHYGKPLDVAYTESAEHGRVVVGWTFSAPPEWARDREAELAAIPSSVGPRGDLVPIFLEQERRRAVFQRIVDEGLVDDAIIIQHREEGGE